jgi:hypothetical protein
MKTKYFIYFVISVLITVFNVFPKIFTLWDTPNGNGMYLWLPLGFASWLLGPVLAIVFFVAWLREMRKVKQEDVLHTADQEIIPSQPAPSLPSSSKPPMIRKSLLYTMISIVAFFIILGSLVSEKKTVVDSSKTVVDLSSSGSFSENFFLVLPFIIFGGIGLAVVMGIATAISHFISKK